MSLIKLNTKLSKMGDKNKIKYLGMDNSIAPIPDQKANSVANLIEEIGNFKFGSNGTLFITSLLTSSIRKLINDSKIKSIGLLPTNSCLNFFISANSFLFVIG